MLELNIIVIIQATVYSFHTILIWIDITIFMNQRKFAPAALYSEAGQSIAVGFSHRKRLAMEIKQILSELIWALSSGNSLPPKEISTR